MVNVLYECSEYFDFLEENKGDILSTGMGFEKEYASGQSILFSYTEKMKFLMEEKSFEYFMNFFIEAPSFFIDGKEVISTITHENYIIFADDFQDSEYFRTKGFFGKKRNRSDSLCSVPKKSDSKLRQKTPLNLLL